MTNQLRLLARRYLARETRRRIARLAVWPPVGWVRFGSLRRLNPISTDYGNSRGLEIDRYYIEKFLTKFSSDIRGHVLEIKHNAYTVRYGGDRVRKSDVLHPVEGNPDATIVADLTKADHLPSNTFDAIIFTQTLQVIYDIRTMTHEELVQLANGGLIDVGAHTRSHPMLPRLTAERQREEIITNKHELEEILGRRVDGFAYPNGRATTDAKQIVREAGFAFARTSDSDLLRVYGNRYDIPRFWPHGWAGKEFSDWLRRWL